MMGGKGSGGARVGSGPARQVGSTRWRQEQRRRREAAGADAPLVPDAPLVVDKPAGLSAAEVAVWDRLAPHALAAKTLTPATAEAFAFGCYMVVLERELRATRPGGPDHRMLLIRVEAFNARFRLAPMGKEMPQVEEPKDDFAEFDQPLTLVKGAKD